MNKCVCASVMNLHRLKPCTTDPDYHCSILPCSSLFLWSLLTNIRSSWLVFVVTQHDMKEQIKFSLGVSELLCFCKMELLYN